MTNNTWFIRRGINLLSLRLIEKIEQYVSNKIRHHRNPCNIQNKIKDENSIQSNRF